MAKRADKKPDEKPRRNRGEAAKTKKVWRCDETPWREPEEQLAGTVCLSAPSSPSSSVRARQTGLQKSVLFFFPPIFSFSFSVGTVVTYSRKVLYFSSGHGVIPRSKWNCDSSLGGQTWKLLIR